MHETSRKRVHQICTLVGTKKPAEQNPHCDFLDKEVQMQTCIVHAPLCSEGAVVSAFDPKNDTHWHVHLPFGMFMVMRGDVWHSGFCGSPGNVHFRVIIALGKMPQKDCPSVD